MKIAEEMVRNILINTKAHFKDRCIKFLMIMMDIMKSDASSMIHEIFLGKYDNVKADVKQLMQSILPCEINKSVYYHLESNLEDFVNSTMNMAMQIEEKDGKYMCFIPLTTGCIPGRMMIDTDVLGEMFFDSGEWKKKRAEYGVDGRKQFNEWAWGRVINMN